MAVGAQDPVKTVGRQRTMTWQKSNLRACVYAFNIAVFVATRNSGPKIFFSKN